MKLKRALGLAVVAGCGVASSAVTTRFLTPREASASASQLPPSAKKTAVAKDAAPAEKPGHFNSLGSFTLDNWTIKAEPGRVAITARVTIEDKRKGIPFLWGVRILDPSGEQILHKYNYSEQVFFVPSDAKYSQNFRDSVALPAGSYTVELYLYGLPTTIDVPLPDNLGDESLDVLLKAVETVTVGG